MGARVELFSARADWREAARVLDFAHVLLISMSSEQISAQIDQMPAKTDQKSAWIDLTPAESGSFQPDSIKNTAGSIKHQHGSIKDQHGSIKCRRESNERRQNRAVSGGEETKASEDRANQSTRKFRGA